MSSLGIKGSPALSIICPNEEYYTGPLLSIYRRKTWICDQYFTIFCVSQAPPSPEYFQPRNFDWNVCLYLLCVLIYSPYVQRTSENSLYFLSVEQQHKQYAKTIIADFLPSLFPPVAISEAGKEAAFLPKYKQSCSCLAAKNKQVIKIYLKFCIPLLGVELRINEGAHQ